MKFTSILAVAAALMFSATSFADSVDTKKSSVTWKGSKVVGSSHTGTLDLKSADLKFAKGEPTSGKVIIDMTTIKNTDITTKSMNKKLVGHLKSPDFFAVEKHKTATLDIKKIQKASDKFYLITGDLIIKGQKQPISVKAEVVKEDKKSKTVKADLKFDRTKFGIKYGSGTFFSDLGDKMIADEVEVSVQLFVNKG